MDKKEVLESVKIDLSEIKNSMAQVESDIVHISSCIEQGKFIPGEVSKNVIACLEKLQKADEHCRERYEILNDSPFAFEKIESFEYQLHEKEEQIRREEIIATSELFLKLHAQEEDIEELLVGEQVKLMGILPVSEDGEDALLKIKPYVDFIEIVRDKKSLAPASIVEAIINLRAHFGDGLIGAAFCKNSILLEEESEGEDEDSGLESSTEYIETKMQEMESSADELTKEAETEETEEQPEYQEKTEEQSEYEEVAQEPFQNGQETGQAKEEGTEQELQEGQETETVDNQITTEQSEEQERTLAEALFEAGAILPETYEYGKVKIEKGDREDKKFGVNSF